MEGEGWGKGEGFELFASAIEKKGLIGYCMSFLLRFFGRLLFPTPLLVE